MKVTRLARTVAVCSALVFGAALSAQAQTLTAPTTTKPANPAPTLTTPAPATAGPTNAARQATSKVNINTASASELDALPNIGDKRSAAIIKARPYKSTDELVSKKVLSKGLFDSIKKHITI
jgi:DNA uptake protein ComE-like DNA-binding protein